MSDFFEQIISRSFGDAAAVRPRLPARFEVEARDLPGAQAPPDAFETEEEAARAGSTASTRGRADDPAERRDEEQGTRERPRRDEPTKATAPRAFPVMARTRRAEEVAAPSKSTRGDNPLASSNDSTPTTPRPRAKEGEPERVPLQAEPPARAQAPPAAEAARAEGQAKHAASADGSRAAPPAIVPRLAPPPANVIQVTIGRIEVTVPTPPARTLPRRTPPAPLRPAHSLDEYLRRRERGGR